MSWSWSGTRAAGERGARSRISGTIEDLGDSGPNDAHVVIDVDEDGRAVLRFGDGEHGAIPAKGDRVEATYRYGSGESGNVPA